MARRGAKEEAKKQLEKGMALGANPIPGIESANDERRRARKRRGAVEAVCASAGRDDRGSGLVTCRD
jgi:hypothetical protein